MPDFTHADQIGAVKGEQADIYKAVFDALPSLVFVVDPDVKIQEYNAAASDLLVAGRKTVLKQRAGDILHCVHSREVLEGCGRAPFCRTCIIRNGVTEAFRGSRVIRRRARLELIREGVKKQIYALISASPFAFGDKSLVLLVIEDISEIIEIYKALPICYICKRVQQDDESWMLIETYFRKNWGVEFTHGLCPECYRSEVEKLE
ncbi:MAG: hypothetical protein C4576_09905 [Desulfobacteraceae bacterium]|nr:MAG: hypothetical protein C4576_09905 [Desulfobacteraceae bacterium]